LAAGGTWEVAEAAGRGVRSKAVEAGVVGGLDGTGDRGCVVVWEGE
jgi:hypothetical protein